MIIGCDFRARYQQIAMIGTATGELVERRLSRENGDANTFYRCLQKPVRGSSPLVNARQMPAYQA